MPAPLYTTARILENSVRLLEESKQTLDSTIGDIPRLMRVLDTQKVFGLVPELDLAAAKERVHTDTHPQIQYLMEQIQKETARLRRKKVSLESKFELNRVRLEAAEKNAVDTSLRTANRPGFPEDEHKVARLKFLRNKRDRLNYSLSRYKLQSARSKLSFIPSLPPRQPRE